MPYASKSFSLLRILARSHPAIWDVIDPLGPGRGGRRAAPLNPQPLPPLEDLTLRVQASVRAIADAAVAASFVGGDVSAILTEVGDDLCPRRPNVPIPWPKRWPLPWPPGEPYPIAPELIASVVQAEAAVVFGSYAVDIADDGLSAAFGQLADRLVDAAVSESGSG